MYESGKWAITFILVPGVMLAMVALGVGIAIRPGGGPRLAAFAGVGAGIVAFTIYFTLLPGTGQAIVTESNAAAFVISVLGAVVAFAVLAVVQLGRYRRALVGLFPMFLVGTNTIALYSYFSASSLRVGVVQFALGSLFGILLYVIIFHDRFKKLFGNA